MQQSAVITSYQVTIAKYQAKLLQVITVVTCYLKKEGKLFLFNFSSTLFFFTFLPHIYQSLYIVIELLWSHNLHRVIRKQKFDPNVQRTEKTAVDLLMAPVVSHNLWREILRMLLHRTQWDLTGIYNILSNGAPDRVCHTTKSVSPVI